MKLKVGDKVEVIAGNDKGTQGEVLRVDRKKNRVVVNNVRMVKKHQKPQNTGGRQTAGGIIEFEAPMDASNVMLVCPKTGKLTKIGIRRDDDGRRIRFSKQSGEDID
ncbi:MAG: 50S ribosomal protein L24 [Candidatus Promineifilaceae bacterium]